MEKSDPLGAELLAKIQSAGGMGTGIPGGPGAMTLPGGPGAPGMGPVRNFDEQIRPPGFLESLPPEDREKFRKAETSAMESEAVRRPGRTGEDPRGGRGPPPQTPRGPPPLRKVTVEEMIRIDPSIAPMQKRLLEAGKTNLTDKKKSGEAKEEKSADAPPGTKKPEKKPE